ncbi:MAG: glycosyltransferase [Oscillospiraceae bacterium]|nr:glycosyltransferase [Oscillospiraceae bacterium]
MANVAEGDNAAEGGIAEPGVLPPPPRSEAIHTNKFVKETNMKRIVCLSTTNWKSNPTRKQQVMSRMTDAEILYFEPPVTFLAPLKDKSASNRISMYREEGERVAENITVYAMPPVLPLYNKYRAVNRINQKRLSSYVREKMKKHGFIDSAQKHGSDSVQKHGSDAVLKHGSDAVLWIYHPSSVDIVRKVPHSALVYDCVDRHWAYPGLIKREVVEGMEAELAKLCDVVFSTAKGLHETLSAVSSDCHLIPNGANYEMFSAAHGYSGEIAEEIAGLKRPVLGFVGALQECIDYTLVREAAGRNPGWSFVFIGAPLPGADISGLEGLPNVHLLGAKPHSELVRYVAGFDVCLNLFRAGELAADVSPLKFFEYLCTGKPVVSTPQPLQVNDYRDAVYIASGGGDFDEMCRRALSEQDDTLIRKRMEYGRECSWDSRVALMRSILAEKNILV